MATLENFVRRYTDLPALIAMLVERQITLLDPDTWDDKNDSYFLRVYKEKKRLQSVLALCFTQNTETYHHWRVFASGSSGVSITFRRHELVRAIRKTVGVRTGRVRYLKVGEIRNRMPAINTLPFLKRYPFEQENEFRVIFESHKKLHSMSIAIPLTCIDRITLSPWLHPALAPHVKKMLRGVQGCSKLVIARSTLINNDEWKNFGDSAHP